MINNNEIFKGEKKMIHTITPLRIMFSTKKEEKYKPQNMLQNKFYEVIANKTTRRKQEQKEIEELHFGFIGEDYQLTFIASFNCFVIKGTKEEDRTNDHEQDSFMIWLHRSYDDKGGIEE
jgi:hypothetical protein